MPMSTSPSDQANFPSQSLILCKQEYIEAARIPGKRFGLAVSAKAPLRRPSFTTATTAAAASHRPTLPAGGIVLKEQVFHGWDRGTYDPPLLAAQLLARAAREPPSQMRDLMTSLFPFDCRTDIPASKLAQVSPSDIEAVQKHLKTLLVSDELGLDLTRLSMSEDDTTSHHPTNKPSNNNNNDSNNIMIAHQLADTKAIRRMLFVLQCNSFPSGLLLFLSLVNHSCDPNCRVDESYRDNYHLMDPPQSHPDYHLTLIKHVYPGEELTISYLDLDRIVGGREERRRKLEEGYLFHCVCDMCGDESVDRVGRGEDYVCGASYAGGGCLGKEGGKCRGRIVLATRTCLECGAKVSAKEMDKRVDKGEKLIFKIRRAVDRLFEAVDALEVVGSLDIGLDAKDLDFDRAKQHNGVETGSHQQQPQSHHHHKSLHHPASGVKFEDPKQSTFATIQQSLVELKQLKEKAEAMFYIGPGESQDPHTHVVFRPLLTAISSAEPVLEKAKSSTGRKL